MNQIETWTKADIEAAFKQRTKSLIVCDPHDDNHYRDFNRGHLSRMDAGTYSVQRTKHEFIIYWRIAKWSETK